MSTRPFKRWTPLIPPKHQAWQWSEPAQAPTRRMGPIMEDDRQQNGCERVFLPGVDPIKKARTEALSNILKQGFFLAPHEVARRAKKLAARRAEEAEKAKRRAAAFALAQKNDPQDDDAAPVANANKKNQDMRRYNARINERPREACRKQATQITKRTERPEAWFLNEARRAKASIFNTKPRSQ